MTFWKENLLNVKKTKVSRGEDRRSKWCEENQRLLFKTEVLATLLQSCSRLHSDFNHIYLLFLFFCNYANKSVQACSINHDVMNSCQAFEQTTLFSLTTMKLLRSQWKICELMANNIVKNLNVLTLQRRMIERCANKAGVEWRKVVLLNFDIN